MSNFLEKNKKKSALAALLLFLRTRKTVTALLLLVALASFLFVSPSNIILHFPGGARIAAGVAWLAGKAGVDVSKWGLVDGKRDYNDLLAAFRAAKEGGTKAGWASFMRGNDGDASKVGGSTGSLDFVKGNRKDLEGSVADGNSLPKPGSVQGVLNPDDAKDRGEGEGVALADNDVGNERAGFVRSAFAGGFANGSGIGGGAPGDGALSGGAFATSGFFGGSRGATTGKLSDIVNGGVEGIKGQTAKGVEIKGGAKGRLNEAQASVINARQSKGLVGTHTISGQRAFVQLAAGRGRAAISVSPNCTPGSGCPGEFAAVNTGAVYDGNTISGDRTDILTAPEIDGISSPNLPDTGLADQYVADAEKMDADAKKCRELDDKYGPQETKLDEQQQTLSDSFDKTGCGQGGCSKSKAQTCQQIGDDMKGLCRQTMTIRCQHIHECPLTKNNNCSPSECDNAPARNKKAVSDVNDGIKTRTMDQGGETAECTSAKQDLPTARQTGLNAVEAYEKANCLALAQDTTMLGKLKYFNTCAGREGQVISTCKNYANVLCQQVHACSNNDCVDDKDKEECLIQNLDRIKVFLQSDAKY